MAAFISGRGGGLRPESVMAAQSRELNVMFPELLL
jgi:hypothetical protein